MGEPTSEETNFEIAATDDRRLDERRPLALEPTFVWVSTDRRFRARVVDTSEGGIGIRVPSDAQLEQGFKVRIGSHENKRTATIRYINAMDGELSVGLSWNTDEDHG